MLSVSKDNTWSISKILGFLINARAIAIFIFWSSGNCVPRTPTIVLYLWNRISMLNCWLEYVLRIDPLASEIITKVSSGHKGICKGVGKNARNRQFNVNVHNYIIFTHKPYLRKRHDELMNIGSSSCLFNLFEWNFIL